MMEQQKHRAGETLSFHLSDRDIAFLQRLLQERGEDPDQWRKAARRLAKRGIYQAIKAYMDAEII